VANVQIPNLPPAIALTGAEQLEVVQAGVSVRTTIRAVANLQAYYGAFYDTSTQTNAGATSANPMLLNSTELSNGVSAEALGKIRITNAGVYNIQFSAQLDKTDGGDDEAEIWLSVNGTNVPWSSSVISIHSNNGKDIPAWNWFYEFAANDYFQIFWHSADTDMRILARSAQTTPTRPAVPSVILTVNLVG
jgi:hypothetical protein